MRKLKLIKVAAPEIVAYFSNDSAIENIELDYRCTECGFGVADDYVACPHCGAELDWGSVQKPSKEFRKLASRLNLGIDIYKKGYFEPDFEQKFEEIEKAMGFQLYFWQKHFIARGTFRQTGETTARILKELLQTDEPPIDYTKKPCNKIEDFHRRETKNIKEKLDNAGVLTRTIYFTKEDKLKHEGNMEKISIGDKVVCMQSGVTGVVVEQYFPTACEHQTMIRCEDGRRYHAPTSTFKKN